MDVSPFPSATCPREKLLTIMPRHGFSVRAAVKQIDASKPLARLHQAEVHQLLAVPLERDRVVPAEIMDVEARAGVGAQGLGGAEAGNGGGDVVVPGAGVGVIFLVAKGVIVAKDQSRRGLEQGDPVDLAADHRHMLFKPPAQAAEKVQLTLFGVVVIGGIGPCQCVIARLVQMRPLKRDGIGELVEVCLLYTSRCV